MKEYFRIALGRAGILIVMALLCLVGTERNAQAQSGFLTINGDPLAISSDEYGTMGVKRMQNGSLVQQYYGHTAKASTLFLNGASSTNRWGNGSSSFITYTSVNSGRFVPVSNTMIDPWTIQTVFDAGTSNVRITQTISYVNGSAYYRISWQIANNSSTTFNDVRFFHGGDTYFAGDDRSQGHWDNNLKMVYLTNPNPAITGIMGLYASLQTPSSHYMEGGYYDVRNACVDGRLPDTVDLTYLDAGYALEWNKNSLAPGEVWTITAFEKWTEAGFVQVFAPADQTVDAGTTVSYQFVIANYQPTATTYNLLLTSSNGWAISLPGGPTVTIGSGQSATINVDLTVPAGTPNGITDILTLTATSISNPSITNADMVTTHIGEIADGIMKLLGGGGPCFIATAAFGSYQEPHVKLLRQFRDTCLLTNSAGKAFVRWYYHHSPKYAAVIAKSSLLRAITRVGLLPLYGVAWAMLHIGMYFWLFFCALICVYALRKRIVRKNFFLLLAIFAIATPSFAMDLNLFKPASGESRFVVNQSSANLSSGAWQWNTFYTYGNKVSKAVIGGTEYDLSKHQQVVNLGIAYGISDTFQLSLAVPYLLNQSTRVPSAVMEIDSNGIGNIVLAGKYQFRDSAANQAGFSIVPFVGLDTGDKKNLISADSTVWGIKCILDQTLNDRNFLTFNLGYANQKREIIGVTKVRNSFLFGAGFSHLCANNRTLMGLEITGRSEGGVFTDKNRTSAEALAFLQQPLGTANLIVGLGTGIIEGYCASDFRGFIGIKNSF